LPLSQCSYFPSSSKGSIHLGNHSPDTNDSKNKFYQLSREDFEKYDYMLVMDRSNLRDIQEKKPNGSKSIVQLFGSYDAKGVDIIEDPYYSDMSNFENVYQQCYRSSIGFLQKMQLIN